MSESIYVVELDDGTIGTISEHTGIPPMYGHNPEEFIGQKITIKVCEQGAILERSGVLKSVIEGKLEKKFLNRFHQYSEKKKILDDVTSEKKKILDEVTTKLKNSLDNLHFCSQNNGKKEDVTEWLNVGWVCCPWCGESIGKKKTELERKKGLVLHNFELKIWNNIFQYIVNYLNDLETAEMRMNNPQGACHINDTKIKLARQMEKKIKEIEKL